MKKLFYMITTVVIAASFASCNKIEQDNNTPVETPAVDGTTTLTISATVPQTKTNLNKGTVRWSAGDVIAVLAEGYESVRSASVSSAAATFDFIVEGWPAGVTPQYAAFTGPYTSDENYNPYKPVWNEDRTIKMTLRSGQPIYNEGSFSKIANISIGDLVPAEGGNYTAVLKNVCGLIMFNLTKPTKKVEISDLNGQPMTGVLNVTMENGIPVATHADDDDGGVVITSKLSGSEETLAKDGEATYYAVVAPGTYTPTITVTPVEGEPIILTAKSSVKINRNEYVDFGTLDAPSGTGEGEGDEPERDPIVLTVAMSYPFTTNLPTTATKSKDTYYLKTDTNQKYPFVLYNPTDGYRLTSGTLRISTTKDVSGYIQFPAIPEYTLASIEITSGNGTNAKDYYVYAKEPIDAKGKLVTTDNPELVHFKLANATPYTVNITGASEGVGYFLESHSTNAQFTKLVLTYK